MIVQGLFVNWPCILDGGRNKFDSYCDFLNSIPCQKSDLCRLLSDPTEQRVKYIAVL